MPGPGSVPVYGEPAAAVAALSLAVAHAEWLGLPVGEEPERLGIDDDRAHALIESRVGPAVASLSDTPQGNVPLAEQTAPVPLVESDLIELGQAETIELMAAYGLELWPKIHVHSEAEAVAAAQEVGYPVVLKAGDGRFVHRLDLGGIRLNIESERALRAAYLSLAAAHPAEVRDTLWLQAMAPPGVACMVTSVEDPAFGPILGFSVGGFVSDLVSDWAYAMPPLTDVAADALARAPRSAALLFGYRGAEPVNVSAVAAVLMRVAQMATDWPQIRRLAINPMLATSSGCYLLGADVTLERVTDRAERRPRRM